MNYKKSHRDQKCRPYATKAIEAGCNILEIDIQSACGKIVLGHNWRPKLPFLFDCTLEDYLRRVTIPPYNNRHDVIIQLDIKEICFTKWGRKRFAKRVLKVLEPYKKTNQFLVSANNGFFRKNTMYRLYNEMAFFCRFDIDFWLLWSSDKDITTVDLWK